MTFQCKTTTKSCTLMVCFKNPVYVTVRFKLSAEITAGSGAVMFLFLKEQDSKFSEVQKCIFKAKLLSLISHPHFGREVKTVELSLFFF